MWQVERETGPLFLRYVPFCSFVMQRRAHILSAPRNSSLPLFQRLCGIGLVDHSQYKYPKILFQDQPRRCSRQWQSSIRFE